MSRYRIVDVVTGTVFAERDNLAYSPDDLLEHKSGERILAAEVQVRKMWRHRKRGEEMKEYSADIWERYLWQGWEW